MIQRGGGRPPFRADHVGSLLRPAALREAFRKHGAGEIDEAAYRAVQDRCIREAVAMQEAVGLKVVTDGESRRGSYWGRFVERLQGFTIKPALFKFRDDAGHEVAFTAPYAAEKIRRGRPLALDEFGFLQNVTHVTAKVTLPAPSTMHFYRCNDFAAPRAYREIDTFLADLAAAFRAEIAALAEAGCRYVQLDEVAVALLCDPSIRAQVEAAGGAPDRLVDIYIEAINQAVAGRPADMVVGVHMCRGNFKGHYLAEKARRGGGPRDRCGAPGDRPAMWVCQHRRRQSAERSRPAREAWPYRTRRGGDLGRVGSCKPSSVSS
jgi:5-methyltetrahydropteroyltriglutamate--homocysteine methyltransferase